MEILHTSFGDVYVNRGGNLTMIKEPEKIYWTINEVCDLCKIPIHTIHQWCDAFSIEPRRNRRGNRMFTRQNVYRIQVIFILLYVEHMTYKGVAKELGLN